MIESVSHQLLTTVLPDSATTTNHYDARDHLDGTVKPLAGKLILDIPSLLSLETAESQIC